MSLVEIKRQARSALHAGMAVPASYEDPDGNPFPSPEQTASGLGLNVRWHNKLARNGALEGNYKGEIIEGIDRLVFNQDELDALGLTLERTGVVTIPGYNASYELDAEEPADGPLNVYWVVTGINGP